MLDLTHACAGRAGGELGTCCSSTRLPRSDAHVALRSRDAVARAISVSSCRRPTDCGLRVGGRVRDPDLARRCSRQGADVHLRRHARRSDRRARARDRSASSTDRRRGSQPAGTRARLDREPEHVRVIEPRASSGSSASGPKYGRHARFYELLLRSTHLRRPGPLVRRRRPHFRLGFAGHEGELRAASRTLRRRPRELNDFDQPRMRRRSGGQVAREEPPPGWSNRRSLAELAALTVTSPGTGGCAGWVRARAGVHGGHHDELVRDGVVVAYEELTVERCAPSRSTSRSAVADADRHGHQSGPEHCRRVGVLASVTA